MVTGGGGGAGGGGITAQAAGLEGQPCVLTYYAPSRGGINGRAGGGAAGVPLYDGSWACAAPPSYAFGTIIRFYYGGRSVDVPVLDRGSAIQGNHFDLLVGPARALGMLDEGRVNARFKVVGKQRQLSAASSGGGARTGTRARGNAPAVMRRPTSSYPLGTRGPVIGTPHAGTHTLGDWQSDNAVDIRVKRGTPVLAVEDGTIVKVVERSDGGGRFAGSQITLRGRSGNSYFYTHLSAVNVTVGEEVSAGEQIGASGVANGVPHLHFGQQRGDPRATLQRKVATLPGVAAGQRPKRKRKRLPNLLGRVVDSAPSPVFGDTGEFTANEPAVTPEPEPGPTRDDWFARALMFAEMSGDPQRILGELRNQEGYLRGDFQAALGTPDPRDDITTGQALQALLDQIKSLEDTVENSAERQLEATRQQLALKEEEVAQLKRERNVSQADLAALRRSFIDMISGELGGRISGGLATPSYAGVGARW